MRASHVDYRNLPPGVIPLDQFTARDIRNMGYDPVQVYRMQEELAEMGLGLGFSIGGLIKGIGKGVVGAAKGVAKGVSTVATKVVAPAAKLALKAAPILLPVAGGAFLISKYGPALVSKAASLLKKAPDQLTEADVQAAQQAAAAMTETATQAVQQMAQPQVAPTMFVSTSTPAIEAAKKRGGLDLNKIMELVARTSQAVPQVQQAVESVREAVAPQAPSTSVTVTAPGGGGEAPPVQQAGVAGGIPGWVPLAAVGAVALLAFGRRK